MAVDSLYDYGRQAFANGEIDWLNDDIYAAAVADTYVPDLANHAFWSDVEADAVADPVLLFGKSTTAGVLDAQDNVFPSVPAGSTIAFIVLYTTRDGPSSTWPLIGLIAGKVTVTAAQDVEAGATALPVDSLPAPIPNGSVLAFSGGTSVTLSAGAAAGARSISIDAAPGAVAADETAEARYGSGLPLATSDVDIAISFDNGANKILTL